MDEVTAQVNPKGTKVSKDLPEDTKTLPAEEEPKKSMAKTFLLIVVLFLAALGLFSLALYLGQQKPQVVTNKVPTPTPDQIQTILSISSIPTPLSTPSAYKTDVVINTGQNSIISVQLELTYDPKVLTRVDINPGPFFVNPDVKLKTIDAVNGRITYAISVPDHQGIKTGILGQGIVAVINFSVLPGQKTTPTTISFLPKTEVSSLDISSSVLKSTVDANFTLSAFGPTLIPTPTSTPSSSPWGN